MLRQLRSLLLSSGLLLGVLLTSGQAQVTTTITPDGTLGTAVTQSGTVHNITGGTRPGNGPNLFHSFDRFSVGTNDIARFSGPTGGLQSVIDGRLQSTIPGANLYLLNPSGILFGPNASLDISGSFHVSTADFLRFADGATFSANVGERSTLTVAPPSAFGFLHSNPARISISGSSLQVVEGKTVSVVGGDIEIVGGSLTSPQAPSLGAPSGRINIASIASSGEVGLDLAGQVPQLDIGTFERLGEIQIAQGAVLNTSGNGGGTTIIRGGRLLVDNGLIAANNLGNVDSPGLGVDVRIRGDVRLTGEAAITSITGLFSQGRGGHISIAADNITIEGGATFSSITGGLGPGGDIAIMAPTGTISLSTGGSMDGGGILTSSLPFSSGSVGEIKVEAGKLKLTNGALIGSLGLGSGKGGNVIVSARESVAISGGNRQGSPSGIASFTIGEPGSISLSAPVVTIDGGAVGTPGILPGQRAGDITVKADQQLTLVNSAQINSATLTDSKGGNITIEAGRLTLTGGAQITSGTSGPGAGGSVTVMATDTVSLTGTAPTGRSSGILATSEGTAIGAGAAGSIVVTAPRITVTEGAGISSSTGGPGAGGSVMVTASDTLTLTGTTPTGAFASGIFANAQGTATGAGAGGSIVVTAPRVMVTDGAAISSSTFGPGAGGSVTVMATDTVSLSDVLILSNAFGRGEQAGNAGRISITALVLTMDNNALIETRTIGNGSAGDVEIVVDRMTITGVAQIGSTSGLITITPDRVITAGTGKGGTVTIIATDAITIAGRDLALDLQSGVFTQTAGPGNAGRIVVSTPQLMMSDGAQISVETGGDGRGGDVVVQTGHLSLTGGAQIRSGSGLTVLGSLFIGAGAGGTVSVTATDTIDIVGQESGLSASTAGQGRGGDVFLQARQVQLTNGATISAESTGLGNAGNITIATGDSFLSTNGSVVTRATQADGGNIQITAPNFLRLRDSAITAEVGGVPQTVGGNITIDPQFVLLQNSQIVANAFAGQGGNIRIQAQRVFLADPASIVSASSALGINGVVNIQAPVTSISGAVAPLPQEFARISELLRDRCAGRLREGRVSRLVLGGRDGVPSEPGSLLLSPLIQTDPRDNEEQVRTPARTGQVQERAWHVQAGALAELEAECARWIGHKSATVGNNMYPRWSIVVLDMPMVRCPLMAVRVVMGERMPVCRDWAHDATTSVIHPHQVKNPLCQVNPEYARIVLHRTRLLQCGVISSNPKSFWLIEAILQRRVYHIMTGQWLYQLWFGSERQARQQTSPAQRLYREENS
jgi:filamentous hemagglutinin family protein